MKMEVCKGMSEWTKLLLRLIVGAVFLTAGYVKFQNPAMIQGMLGTLNYPLPEIMGWILIITELLGGALIVLGLFTCWASIPMSFVMLMALLTVHLPSMLNKGAGFLESGSALVALTMAVLLHLMTTGAGKISVDHLISKKKQ
ncbi:DoxX family protein [Candidatus Peregrinibacteria bacterium]|nr:DoxX family protein [Candidatus Peregrinibacteria bacterium]